jgi:class 3 adenylate cyclase
VTVLFADLKGSMGLSESIDPDEWHQLLDRFFAILSEGLTGTRGRSTSSPATGSWPSPARRSLTRIIRGVPAT